MTTEERLEREARQCFLGRLGDRDGVNVARVEVSWFWDDQWPTVDEQAGYFLVHATGDEPDGIYSVFESLVGAEMDERAERDGWGGWTIDDIYAA